MQAINDIEIIHRFYVILSAVGMFLNGQT